ncbi:MAG: hypothetical protein U0Q16_04855 [Bryobacteraceae bacterium]
MNWKPWITLCASLASAQVASLDPAAMKRIGMVDARFQSYNVEMVEVTGGRFWAPYRSAGQEQKAPETKLGTPGIDPSLFSQRKPLDLTDPRLRKLAAALGPAYIRVSGSWANSTYFHDSDEPVPVKPPPGFGGILTRDQWRGVIEFSRSVDAKIVTSFAISPGTRDDSGTWTPKEAGKLLAFTKAAGGTIAAAELFNEPSFAEMAGAPKGYTAAQYGRDFAAFRKFVNKTAPGMVVAGPGSVGEKGLTPPGIPIVKSQDMLAASGDSKVDVFSYHFYGGVSKRCSKMGSVPQSSPETALSEEWLSKTDTDLEFYGDLRDRFEPGKKMWLTETGETACGGNPWASTFIDSFRYLDQLGRLAKRGVQVVAHNTLAASDYALIDEETMTPRPNYWSALLWHKLMGTTVLDAGASSPGLHVYAHCMPEGNGGVSLLAINNNRSAVREVKLGAAAERYTLSAGELLSAKARLNGRELALGADGSVPALAGSKIAAGTVRLEPATITFFAMSEAKNAACR